MTEPEEEVERPNPSQLGAARIQELMVAGVEASARHQNEKAYEVLHVLMHEGNRVDCLAFIIGCLFTIRRTLPKNARVAMDPDLAPEEVNPAKYLFSLMLVDYLAGDTDSAYERWIQADNQAAAGALGCALKAAGDRLRQMRAALQ